jgi:hypothetical protein
LDGLSRPLGVHLVFLIVYTAIVIGLAALAGSSFTLDGNDAGFWAELCAFAWLVFIGGPIWVLVAALVVRWWWQQRQGLVQPTLVWDSLLWLGPAISLLLLLERSARRLVPPPNTG